MRNPIFARCVALLSFVASLGASLAQAAAPQPEPPVPTLEYVMTVRAAIDPVVTMGRTPQGERRMIAIKGGTFEGPRLKGTIMPGGEDWQVDRNDGVTELDARYWLRTDDGAIIRVQNRVLSVPPTDPAGRYRRGTPTLEAPIGKYDWLNKAIFSCSLDVEESAQGRIVVLRFYRLTMNAPAATP